MAAFTANLRSLAAGYLDKPVVDSTNLPREWDLTVKWTTHQTAGPAAGAISVFDAFDKQLGLKLSVTEQPATVVVVDNVNPKPTENPPGTLELLPSVSKEFEVGIIRPTIFATPSPGAIQRGDRFEMRGATLKSLLTVAWHLPEDMIIGPKWIDTTRFDVLAKAPADVSISGPNVDADSLRAMLKALLVEQFKISFHNEDRPVSVYAVTTSKGEPKSTKADPSVRSGCRRAVDGGFACQNTSMAQFVERLPVIARDYVSDRPVVDLTGIEGGWDFKLIWSGRAAFEAATRSNKGQPGGLATAPEPDGILSLFEAIEKQLGLRLQEQKHTMPVLVVDHVEPKPLDN
jgi:uncharacterized protein (TIGR03435 family)